VDIGMAQTQDDHHTNIEEHSKLFRDLLLGFVKVHVLYHASREPIYGAGITAELDQHGYKLSPGTLYPLLHSLEAANFVAREDRVVDGKVRKYYRTTPLGDRAFSQARLKVMELVEEISDAGDRARDEGDAARS
jgi:PadR family transcriptional regulator PadR